MKRRDFLKCSALMSAVTTIPSMFSVGQETTTPIQNESMPQDGLLAIKKNIRAEKLPRRKITIPNVGQYQVIKGDFHIHTLFSDGHVMPKVRVDEAIQNGLDVIAITDHIEHRPNLGGKSIQLLERNDDHNIAYEMAKPVADKAGLILVRGTEITKQKMPPGHLNAIFLEDANKVADVVDDWKKMIAVAADQGAFVFWNHPGWVRDGAGLKKGEPMRFTDEHEEAMKRGHLHGVEVFNGSSHYPIAADWCNDRNLAYIGTSDIHVTELEQYGEQNLQRPMTLIFATEKSYDAIREAFFARRTVVWAAGMILGPPEWVEKLFSASVDVKRDGNKLTLQNRSDIPCQIVVEKQTHELPALGLITIPLPASSKKITIANWFVGMAKPLEVAI
ncbi:MAG: PHP domain-containing protein [Thermoguttaceae bacterium]